MDLTIPMGCKEHSNEAVKMIKGLEKKNAQTKKLLEKVQKRYEKHVNKTQKHVEFEIGQHMWLNIQDFKMPNELAHVSLPSMWGL